MSKKQTMVHNVLGWHLKTDRPLGNGTGVYAACGGGLIPPHVEAKRARPTCKFCLKIQKDAQ